jgi:group I intron endonuclease
MINNCSGIYAIFCKDKLYIGSAVNLRIRINKHFSLLKAGKHPNTYMQNSYIKYGLCSFSYKILECCNKENLIQREQFFIDKHKPIVPKGFNVRIQADSCTGSKRSQESIRKAYETKIKNGWVPFSTVDRNKLKGVNHPRYGVKVSDEVKKKISQSLKGRIISEENKQKLRLRSIKHTDEAKAKLSKALMGNKNNLGKKLSNETKQKISIANKGKLKPHSDATKRKISETMLGRRLAKPVF